MGYVYTALFTLLQFSQHLGSVLIHANKPLVQNKQGRSAKRSSLDSDAITKRGNPPWQLLLQTLGMIKSDIGLKQLRKKRDADYAKPTLG